MEIVILNSNRIHSHLYLVTPGPMNTWLWKKQYRILDADLDINSLLNNMEVAPIYYYSYWSTSKILFPVPTTLSSNLQVWVLNGGMLPQETQLEHYMKTENGSNTSTSQECQTLLQTTRARRKPGGDPLYVLREYSPEDTLILASSLELWSNRFWVIFCHLVCGTLLWQPWK